MRANLSLFRAIIFAFLCAVSFHSFTQVADDFTDGDFTSNPAWMGDTAQFQITSSSAIPPELKPALQLYSEGSDTSYLCLANTMIMNTEWRFWIKLSFNTSANNFARVYLVSDMVNPDGQVNGYFVQIGGSEDSIALYKQSGADIVKLIPGTVGYSGNSTNIFRIKVTHDNEGIWKLWSATGGGYDFSLEGTTADNSITATNYFAIYCKYTSSNCSKFYFDDFFVNEIVVDTIPPEIAELIVISFTSADVIFNEPVDITSSQDTANYFVNNGIGCVMSATRDECDFSVVHLSFAQSFEPGINYTLTVHDISDLNGNTMENDWATFQYVPPVEINPYDIVINEIMADENPLPAGLPEADYLEIFNRTDHSLQLANCTLKPRESSDPLTMPSILLEPNDYMLIVSPSDTSLFEPYGQVIGLSGFSLNNEGIITLRNPQGSLICAVSYTDEWYNDDTKKEGGWSLEQIDPENPCAGKNNWSASNDSRGGSPGAQNSVYNTTISTPEISFVEITNSNLVVVTFTHQMDSLSLINPNAYTIDQGIGNPTVITISPDEFVTAMLEFDCTFSENNHYTLTITDTLRDCKGDLIALNSAYSMVLPSVAGIYDIVINEIMADPDPPVGLPEYEFIEIYNTTSSYLKMTGWTLQVGTSVKSIPSIVMESGEYVLFTENEAADLYGMLARSIGFSSLGLTNSGTSLKLLDQDSVVISSVCYNDEWYNDSEKCEGGWSLEQIDPINPCPGRDNWTVSLDERGGSPGIINSVFSENIVEPAIIRVVPVTGRIFTVGFNQMMDIQSLMGITSYFVDRGIGNPENITIDSTDLSSVTLEFSQELETRKLFTLTLTQDIRNCTGIPVAAQNGFQFGIPEICESADVVINEVLFNPADDGVDFVEIYNRSEKIIDLGNLLLGTIEVSQFEANDTVYKSVSEETALLLSGTYQVLTSDPYKVKEQYFTSNPDGFMNMISFPAYNNDAGDVMLSNTDGTLVDAFKYTEDMHYPLLNSTDGVSLERIHFDRSSSDLTNWHSASEDCGYATPGYKNSQFTDTPETNDMITIMPEVFSPDNDGYNDIVSVIYHFDAPGYTGTITIFDAQGRLVKTLVNNELLGTNGEFSWDGRTNANQKADVGIYLVYLEAFDMSGRLKKIKKTVVLGSKF